MSNYFLLVYTSSATYIRDVPLLKKAFIGFRLTPELREELEQIANAESRSVSQICELLLRGGVESYRKEGPKYLHRLVSRKKEI